MVLLAGAYLVLVAVVAGVFCAGIMPFFDGWRWVPALVASVSALPGALWLFFSFGFWGAGMLTGQDWGDQYAEFSPGQAALLGWWRLLIQILAVGAVFVMCACLWMDFRVWRLTSTPEIDALPALATKVPIPQDWAYDRSEDGFASGKPLGPPQAQITTYYAVPEDFGYDELQEWLASPAWNGSFGALQNIECSESITWCDAEQVPVDGRPVEHYLEVRLSETRWGHSVDVELTYRHPDANPDGSFG